MGLLLLLGACVYSVPIAAIATFVTWVVRRIRKKGKEPNYIGVFLRWLVVGFFGFLILILIASGGNLSPAGH
jgi:hypothetical protein